MLEQKVLQTIEKNNLIQVNDKIVIGVSGGPDSICLLHILIKMQKRWNMELIVAHVNHMIRKEAPKDEKYVKKICEKWDIPFYVKRINVVKKAHNEKVGIEEAGRKARYDFFNEILQKNKVNKIATAHNQNDVAETLIMNILRGSGTNGLKSIEPIREGIYIRPLINIPRTEIEEYCKQNTLEPRIDKTNQDNTYTRNKVRNIVIPYIQKEFNSNIVNTLSRLSEIIVPEIEYLNKQTKEVYTKLLEKEQETEIILNLKQFNEQDLVIKRRLVLYTINKLLGNHQGIEKIHIDDILKLCCNNIGNKYLTPNKHIKIMVRNKKIIFNKTLENA